MTAGVPIYTIGYGGRAVDEFLGVIAARDIQYVIDVRSIPYSKFKPEFSREILSARLEQSNVGYVFMGDALGGKPEDDGCYGPGGRVLYERCRLRPAFVQGLESLEAGWEADRRIVLMCSEGKPQECHRTKLLAEELVALGIPVAHIDESGQTRTHAEIMEMITDGQGTLFGEHTAVAASRKRHRVAS